MLYRSNVLLYDRQTESLWSQIKREAITGPMTGTRLQTIPSKLTTWKRWRKSHPGTLVLSTDTGFRRDYSTDPYERYHRSPFAMFGLGRKAPKDLPEKELVFGVEVNGAAKAYPFSVLKRSDLPVKDIISGKKIEVHFDPESEEAYATDPTGKKVEGMVSYWFAWHSFHPETKIYKSEENKR